MDVNGRAASLDAWAPSGTSPDIGPMRCDAASTLESAREAAGYEARARRTLEQTLRTPRELLALQREIDA